MGKIAQIGCGYWGENLIRNFMELEALYAIYDENKQLLKNKSQKHCIKSIPYEEILGRDDISSVVIATPAETHFRIAKDCLLNNKNVFVEKPLCINMQDAKELDQISSEKGLILMVGHLLQYHDHFIELKNLVESARMGNVLRVRSCRKSFGKARFNEDVVWSFAPHDVSMINLSLIHI